ncbi:type II toxin-antitoxin system death-on-curing family toxin [Polynucleobacter kasalickyi]|uniref:Death on curing protein n=1 Tax=Polynucleobacter kasalickyi TaxID=1938817 RepID=A0A1W1Y2L4_9BURK|nr:type II toxin-antitoxin system death-on-curing family toxin [Polynucleobacter kasalickyi]SMC30460.1 death on curing protein [Polynucleobacter kasalickyi]
MHFHLLDESDLVEIHDSVIGSHELQGLAVDKSLSGVLARLQNRINYGLMNDVFQYAACAGIFIAKAHCFNDANKRTAAAVVHLILLTHNYSPNFDNNDLGKWIVLVVNDALDEGQFAEFLRQTC